MRVVTQNLWGLYYPLDGRGVGRARPGAAIHYDDDDQVADLLGPGYHVAHQTRREADGSGISTRGSRLVSG